MPAAAVANPRFFWLGPTSNYQVRGAFFGDAQGTDPNFEAPSSYRANLALDLVTQNGYEITFEYNKDDVKQSAFYRDLGITRTGQLADGRELIHWLKTTGSLMILVVVLKHSVGQLKKTLVDLKQC